MLFGMTNRIRRTIRNYATEDLPHDITDQQLSAAPSSLSPQLLMDMVLCDARAYAIKFVATRKKHDKAEMTERQEELDDAVRLLELDTGQDRDTTNKLLDTVNTLCETLQAHIDYDKQETARKYMARRNLEAETPSKNFCNQIKKSKQKAKLTCLFQERNPTPEEAIENPTQKQYEEISSQAKNKNHVK